MRPQLGSVDKQDPSFRRRSLQRDEITSNLHFARSTSCIVTFSFSSVRTPCPTTVSHREGEQKSLKHKAPKPTGVRIGLSKNGSGPRSQQSGLPTTAVHMKPFSTSVYNEMSTMAHVTFSLHLVCVSGIPTRPARNIPGTHVSVVDLYSGPERSTDVEADAFPTVWPARKKYGLKPQ